jgi:uncharacterized protein YjbJ (UPF0337 family)
MNPSSGKQLPQDWQRGARERWPQLTDDDYRSVGGQPDRLIDTVQKRYSVTRDDAEEQVEQFCSSCGEDSESGSKSFGSQGSRTGGSQQGSRTGNTGQEKNPRYGEQSQGSSDKEKSQSGGQNPSGQPGQQGNRPRQTSGS